MAGDSHIVDSDILDVDGNVVDFDTELNETVVLEMQYAALRQFLEPLLSRVT